ncbi:MAG: hypothetical protein R2712_06570 [Vicinamibacterales bacterium]
MIAGNGQFPFLMLDAARAMGHDVTVVAIKKRHRRKLEAARAGSPPARAHWISLNASGGWLKDLRGRRTRR